MKCQRELQWLKIVQIFFQKKKKIENRLYLHVIVIACFILGTHIGKHYLLKLESF